MDDQSLPIPKYVFPTPRNPDTVIILHEVKALDREAWRVIARYVRSNPKMKYLRTDVDRLDRLFDTMEEEQNAQSKS